MIKLLISACLLGERVRYDGKVIPCRDPLISRWEKEGRLVPVCPEVMAGLPAPRPPAEIVRSGNHSPRQRVLDAHGEDLTGAFVRGAEKTLKIAMAHGITIAILKEGSPSCGSNKIYDGTFSGRKIPGRGLTSALLLAHNIRVFSEDETHRVAALLKDNKLSDYH